MTEKEIERWWDEAAEYYQKEISGDRLKTVSYGPLASTENKLKLLGSVNGKQVLDLGCGGGQCAISLAKKGAICTGIDISAKQLGYAAKLANANSVDVKFIKNSFSNLKIFRNNSYDIVVSILALQYAGDLSKVFTEVKRILKKNGIFVFSFEHPFYLLIEPNGMTLSNSYQKTGQTKEEETWPDGSKHKFFMYRRKISGICDSITDSGLKLVKIIEPFDPDDKVWGHGYRRKLVHMVPPTIIFKCIKN